VFQYRNRDDQQQQAELAGEPANSWRQRAARPRQTDNEAAARLWTCGRCAGAHRQPPWTTLSSSPPLPPSPTCPQPPSTTFIPSIPEDAKSVVIEHHENFDGTGYPKGLQGDEISKLARLVSIADVFDALTTNRSYHKAVGPDEALNIMYGMQPGKFDPNIFKSFDKNFSTKSNLQLPEGFDPCAPQKFPLKKAA
jgi:hypothetical protein